MNSDKWRNLFEFLRLNKCPLYAFLRQIQFFLTLTRLAAAFRVFNFNFILTYIVIYIYNFYINNYLLNSKGLII